VALHFTKYQLTYIRKEHIRIIYHDEFSIMIF